MAVTSLSYLLFVVLLWVLAVMLRGAKSRQVLLLIASYLFYASWGITFLAILITSSVLNFGLGQLLRKRPTLANLWLGIGVNVLILAVFKYIPPLVVGAPANSGVLTQLIMPVGISFWTFQALSYLFDLYREEELNPSLPEFCLYMSFWPTVLAGPISRVGEMLPQFRKPAAIRFEDISKGVQRILAGLFMKLVLAQILSAGLNPGEGVSAGFDQINHGWSGIDVWLLAIGYGFQLFFDFAGYSNIAIGVAQLFGIRLPENFERPYLALTPSSFWTRWHMSLSFWIRDYVFMPLATLRRGVWWRQAALLAAMTLFGLWHGATLLFVAWGAYHGLLLVGHRQLQQWTRGRELRISERVLTPLSWAITFALVSLGWIFFRANNVHQAIEMLTAVVSPGRYGQLTLRPNFYIVTVFIIGCYFIYHLFVRLAAKFEDSAWSGRVLWLLSPVRYAIVIFLTLVWSKQEAVFVYFQF